MHETISVLRSIHNPHKIGEEEHESGAVSHAKQRISSRHYRLPDQWWATETVIHASFMKTVTSRLRLRLRLSILPVTCLTDFAFSITSPGITWKRPSQFPFTTNFASPFLLSQALLHDGTLRAALSAKLRKTVSGSAIHVESPTGLHALTS